MKTISKDDLYGALGVSAKSTVWVAGLLGFGLGALCGSLVALLLAPKSGQELRGELLSRGRQMAHGALEPDRAPARTPPL